MFYIKQSPSLCLTEVALPLLLLWLQNCVVVSFFDSDYKQIICLILAEVSAFVHVFVSLSLEHGQQPNSVHISVTEVWFNEAAKLPFLHKFAETWLTICEMQLIRKYFYTKLSWVGLNKSYSRVKMLFLHERDVDMGTCLRYIRRSTWVHHHGQVSIIIPSSTSCQLSSWTINNENHVEIKSQNSI